MSEYLLINIFIILVPLVFSFEKKLKFYRNIPFVLISILVVGAAYITWDVIATERGDWAFNTEFILGFKFFHLPLEEFLFFVTVPYACLFIYETGKFYLGDKKLNYNKYYYYALSVILFLVAVIFSDQYYTFTLLIFCGLFVLIANIFCSKILKSKLYWSFITFCFVPFFVVNYLLTSFPIVTYNPQAIWGIRVTTIPIEDFFYSYSMLSLYLLTYLLTKNKWQKKKELQ